MRNKVLIAFMCTTVMSLTINAQNKPADKAFQLQKYQKAIKLYKLALEKGVDSLYNAEKLAATYQTIGDLANAEVWYAKVADNKNAGINVVEQYAEVLRSNKKFTEASRYYDLAVKSGKATQRTKEALASMDKIRVLDRPQPAYSVELLPFNTSRSEQSPIISEQGKILLASNKLKGANKPDKRKGYTLYEAFVDSNAALTKYSGTKQQNKFNYSSSSSNGKELVYSKNRFYKCAHKALKDSAFNQLYTTNLQDGVTSKLSFQADGASYATPTLSPDGKTLYFSSNMAGGNGGWDIYVSKKDASGNWSKPENAGSYINSAYNETNPFLATDGTLYFSSDAPVGLGGLDVYKSNLVLGEWSKPTNLGAPVNSGGNDFGFVLDSSNTRGFMTSNRTGGMGGDDVYRLKIDRSKLDYDVTVHVTEGDNKAAIDGAKVALKCNSMNLDEITTDKNGNATVRVRGGQKCAIEITKPGYSSNTFAPNYNMRSKPIEIGLKRSEMKLQVTISASETGATVRDAAITLESSKGVRTYATDASGMFTCTIDPSLTYKVASPDFASIKDEIVIVENDMKSGTINKFYSVNSDELKINVPLTADCFEPNSVLSVTDISTGETINAHADEKGYVRLDLKSNNLYLFTQNNATDTIKTFGLMPGDVVQDHCKFFVGQTWLVNNIYYDLNKSTIRKDAAADLDRLVRLMKSHATLEIELGSHTDCRSSAAYNNMLSARRAKAAVDYIGNKGISRKRIIAAGYGESKLLNSCACEPENTSSCTDAEHAVNRRTEVKVLKY